MEFYQANKSNKKQGIMKKPLLKRKMILLSSGLIGILLVILAPGFYVLGHLTGLVAGVVPRFDYMPFFLRVMMVTLILMPFAYRWRLSIRGAAWKKDAYSMIGVSFGMAAFSVVAVLLVFLSDWAFSSGFTELLVLVVFLLLSRVIYHNRLHAHYRSADFC